MMARAIRFMILAAVMAMPPAAAQAQPPAAPAKNEAPKATASIRGRITAADTGRGLRRAQVSISGGDVPQHRRTAPTNGRGDFELRDLPPGRYTLSVTRSGYLSFEYGQRRLGERGKTIELSEGEAMTAIDVALPRASVISGRVLDENAEPVPGVAVWVMRPEFFRGRRRLVPVIQGVRTDDAGQYRATGLGAGEYVVLATLRETWVTGGAKKQVLGYAATYFPGTVSVAEAQRVKLPAAREASNVDITLIAAPAATISGTARSSDGTSLVGASINLSQVMIGPSGSSFSGLNSAIVDAEGGWRLKDVAAGEYELSVTSVDRTRGRETLTTKLQVQGADIDGVALVTEAAVTLTGDVVTDSGVPLPQAAGSWLRVTVESTGDRRPDQIAAGDDNGQVRSDGTFTLTAPAGSSIVRVAPLPRGWAIKSVETGGRDLPDGAIEFKGGESYSGTRIVLTNRFPSVSGRITDDRATNAEGTVVLFPADDSRWLTATATIRSGRTDQKGIFRFDAVPPGDYCIVALEAVQTWQVNDPEFLAEIKPHAERLSVHEGTGAQVALRLRK